MRINDWRSDLCSSYLTTPLLVPYIDPCVRLAHEVRSLLRRHIDAHGEAPKVIYLRNHGMFTLGAGTAEVLGITAMAQKCARVILGAGAVGGVQIGRASCRERVCQYV